MEIKVNKEAQRFYLAVRKWESVIGHEIKVGDYRFCAIPSNNCINVSEVTSGAKVFSIPTNEEIILKAASKEDLMNLFHRIGESLRRIVIGTPDFDTQLTEMKKTAFERLGEMPRIENIDEVMILADESDVLN